MITGIEKKHKANSSPVYPPLELTPWQQQMSEAIRDPKELFDLLNLKISDAEADKQLYFPKQFRLLVPLTYVNKIKKGDWNDPLLKQILPIAAENNQVEGFMSDPVGDLNAVVSNGVLQKYQGRVLLITTGACAVHCRYCFRRHFPYAESTPDKKHWQNTLNEISKDKTIHEVILSGGDPLMLSDQRLAMMCAEIAAIPHVKTLRFHTRLPVILPDRINPSFFEWLDTLKLNKVMVIHANHANEIDDQTGRVLNRLADHGITVLNQSVLLREINDDVESLVNLSHRLFEFKVLPYYLHLLDKVQGAAHFEVEKKQAIRLVKAIKQQLPGYLVPKLVKEVSGERSKRGLE